MTGTKVSPAATAQLSIKQQNAIQALLEEPTITAAAKRVRVGRTTIYFWLRQREFTSKLEEQRQVLFRAAIDRLATETPRAIQVLSRELDSTDASQRRLAATALLNFSFRGLEFRDIDKRITELEIKAQREDAKE